MTLLAVERIKFASTRSPWWCAFGAIVLSVGFSAMLVGVDAASQGLPTLATTQAAYPFGMTMVMVMATLAVTTEYRYGTIKTTFLAVPRRSSALLAKAVLVALISGAVGLIAAFTSWALGAAIAPADAVMSLSTADDWRQVAGVGLVYAFAAVLAVAVGILVRHTAGAVTALLVYTLVLEKLLGSIPGIGEAVAPWLPFNASYQFLTQGAPSLMGTGVPPVPDSDGTWLSIIYFAAVAVALLVVAVRVAERRDA